jgi:uncharacterized protein (TIGR03000 family)
MYGVIAAAMLTTTTAATPDCWWGCYWNAPYAYPAWYGYYYYPYYYYPYYVYYPWYAYYGWPVLTYPTPARAAQPGPSARERALEAQIQELREQIRRMQGGKPPPKETAAPAPARVVVQLPADARLFVDDDPCPLTSAKRSFNTPDLRPGVTYHYTIRAEVTRDGRAVTESKRVTVRAGEETVVEFGDLRPIVAASR